MVPSVDLVERSLVLLQLMHPIYGIMGRMKFKEGTCWIVEFEDHAVNALTPMLTQVCGFVWEDSKRHVVFQAWKEVGDEWKEDQDDVQKKTIVKSTILRRKQISL